MTVSAGVTVLQEGFYSARRVFEESNSVGGKLCEAGGRRERGFEEGCDREEDNAVSGERGSVAGGDGDIRKAGCFEKAAMIGALEPGESDESPEPERDTHVSNRPWTSWRSMDK